MNPSILSAALFRTLLVGAAIMLGRGLVPQPTDLLVVLAIGAIGALIDVWIWEAGKHAAPAAPVDTGNVIPKPDPGEPTSKPSPAPASGSGDAGFAACMPYVRAEEGGNDKAGVNGPNDPRTSRGITQPEWDNWRSTRPGLPADVWDAPEDQISAIFKTKYWDAMNCGQLPLGIALVVFDYGVHSGIGRAPKVLQTILHVDIDGEIGPDTVTAANNSDQIVTINAICDQRLSFLKSLSIWNLDKNDFTRRVANMRAAGIKMATGAAPASPATPPTAAASVSGAAIIAIVTSLDGEHWTSGAPDPTITSWIEFIATKWPKLATYARSFENHGYFAWCGLTVGYVMSKAGYCPPDEFFLAADWLKFGTEVDTPQPGDVLVYQWGDGSHHVSLYDHETPGALYASHGGNQSHSVNVTQFPMASCIGIRRPS